MASLLETLRFNALQRLATERFGPINAGEEEILRLCASSDSTEISGPAENTLRSEISGEFLRWLATDRETASHIDPFGLRVNNCIITSALSLDNSRLSFPLHFQHCYFPFQLSLSSAVLTELLLSHCETDALIIGDNLETQGTVSLRGHQSKAEIRFVRAVIGGDLDLSGASLEAEGRALFADRVKVSGNLFLHQGFSCNGEISIIGAQINGDLDCSGSSLSSTHDTLKADGAHISGNVFLSYGFSSKGAVRLMSARIDGNLDCCQSRIARIDCEFMRLEKNLTWTAVVDPKNSYFNLLGASIGNLSDDTKSWPISKNFVIKGSEYKNLTHHRPSEKEHIDKRTQAPQRQLCAHERITWLSLQDDEDRPDPHAWMWLAKLLKEKDDIAGYRRIICEYRRLKARKHSNRFSRPFHLLLAEIERNPWSILLLFFSLLLAGTLIYANFAHNLPPTNADAARAWADGGVFPAAYPRFNPLIYTLENELPLVKFGIDDKWAPDPNLAAQGHAILYWFLAGFRWFLIAAGWLQGVLLTVGVNRRFRD